MIKINLANTLVAKSGTKTTSSAKVSTSQLALKVVLVIMPLFGLNMVERKILQDKQQQLVSKNQEQANLTEELAKVGSVDDIVRQVQEQKKDLDEKFNVMRQIFSLRARKIKTLSYIQETIQPSSWLTKVSFEEKEVKLEGYAESLGDAQTFSDSLSQEMGLFKSVALNSSVNEKVNGVEKFKFDITIELEE